MVIDERELTGERLADAHPRARRATPSGASGWPRRCATLARPDAAARIADRVWAAGGQRRRVNVLGKTHRMHFVGIGGIGMSGIAELLANLGYAVSAAPTRSART